jgi:1,4-dihydroxy-2-naphthoate octaprenyltransferase
MNAPSGMPLEPTPERLRSPVARYLLATRPRFLTITLVGCLLGIAIALHSGVEFDATKAVVTLVLGLLTNAGVNVLNDYYDHVSGTDEINMSRVYPFTGGSRFIQNGVLTPSATLTYGLLLFLLVIAGGLWLIAQSGPALFWIGLSGLFIGWAYSAPPLKLNSRGWGEICVVAGFVLVVAGADTVQRGAIAGFPWLVGLPYALLTANILFINQFPDREADRQAGKHHWVVKLALPQAVMIYAFNALIALAALLLLIGVGMLPLWSIMSLAGFVPVLPAWRTLKANADQPARLVPAITSTILAAHLHAVLLSASLLGPAIIGSMA